MPPFELGIVMPLMHFGPDRTTARWAEIRAVAAALGLIDEYRARVYPVLVGGGIPYFPRHERRVDLELVETRTFSSGVVYLRYRVVR